MENSVLLTPNDEKELLDRFLNNPDLRRLRVSFNRFWPNPIWWCAVRKNAAGSRLISHPRSAEIWMDPRITGLHCRGELMGKMRAHPKELTGFHVECRLHGLMTYCIPLVVNQRRIGVLAMSHLKPVSLRRAPLEMLNSHVRLLLEGIRKEMELKRVSDSVRPRAIALSTVHTVHRIINSTLNLDELVTRLANLTAQVLRAKTCTIFLYAAKPIKGLVEKASSGAAVSRRKPRRVLRPGEGMEGRVYTTARYVFRRNTLCVPLIDEDVMGVITLRDKKEDGKFDRFDLEILTTLAEEAVVAIKNALLYEEQKKVTLGAIQSLAAILGARFADSRKLSPAALLKITLAVADVLQLSEEEKQAYVVPTVRMLLSPEFVTDAGIRCAAVRHESLLDFSAYHWSHASWPKDTEEFAQGLDRYGFYPEAEQMRIRMINAVNIAGDTLELFYVDGEGRVNFDPHGKQAALQGSETQKLTMIATNRGEENQAWTDSSILRAEAEMQRGHHGESEGEVLRSMPIAKLLKTEEEILEAYPRDYYFLIDTKKGKELDAKWNPEWHKI